MKTPLVAMVLLLAGCVASHKEASPTAVAPALEGTRWTLATAVAADGSVIDALVKKPGKPISISFQQDRIGIAEACNGMGGQYRLDGTTLTVPMLISTKMACEAPLMAAEGEVGRQFQGKMTAELQGDQLVLKTAAGATLTFDHK